MGAAGPVVVDVEVGPGLPALRIGSGPRTLVYLPGLSLHPGPPTGMQRKLAVSGWEALADDYTIVRIGRRVRPVGTSFSDMAQDVVAAMEELRTPVDLLGASTGGMLALHVAASQPDIIRRLVLVIAGARLSDAGRRTDEQVVAAVRAGRWRTAYSKIMPIGARTRLRRFAYRSLGWLLGPRLMGVPNDPTLVLAELEAWMRIDDAPKLERISSPTLILGGADDPVFPPEITNATGREITGATVVIVPGLAHNFPAQLTSDHIAPFLLR